MSKPNSPFPLKLHLEAQKNTMTQKVDFVVCKTGGGHFELVTLDVKIGSHEPSEEEMGTALQPTFSLYYEQAQQALDELWKCGFRPSWETQGPGELEATKAHLKDMRALLAEALGAKLP